MSDAASAGAAPEPDHRHPVTAPGAAPDPGPDPVPDGLGRLVGEWLEWAEVGSRLGISVSRVRVLIREHQLAAAVPVAGAGQRVPAAFLDEGEIVKGVPGVLTVLHDAGYDDREIIAWLFTPDDTLPGRPIDALRENRGSEVKRRAQSMGF